MNISHIKRLNCIVVLSPNGQELLFCRRQKEPYKGRLNFVGGHVEEGEDEDDAAYRELFEETGITREDIVLHRVMDFTYYHQEFVLEIYTGRLMRMVELEEELNPLLWLGFDEDFTDEERFAGNGNMAHIVNVEKLYPLK